ncbi:16S rRNA (adenine(1518)-N(6)/adenine(1519)-N(6))-dimethyltransferase RsmA [Clostridium cochlearium]|uniref:Ribosomal RNA small subunit methyltransferase A n=1 Tax=Clostridium cochlearium TaxID=1494 RepID=A0A239Z057_CLOCO|nr:16S rRNA (adenine(1518)-N(6)/adenine(1519)-N(6))-dimethyltransferase RsmA [Clostridium cochlearium]MBV1820249.1 16S rRNA (adenine(1518)-N(6)/adenine(1519)-N(6))-dimethyltransferase RsmA [Bacteroidales bacterium MSK.15.36]NSJ91702.1 16S rRNA (adenine(1518)-N(6)/adenine(1519)-N(6))-dimethyltransferase RsmA [Coprococcus sp. MSK.21.13]MBE6065826.1 16S rRNA (adenine(1518)-N(6)/adenine(1519)-N(6))-dimethyltransferase RsmA [Clostridium cochlearium]MBU5269967.1 16S rRNA (adenine(1518)-N(6)/adenine(1
MKKNNTKDIVNKYNFSFTKSLGQNFLIDDGVIRDIVEGADVEKEDVIVEIGPGSGALTRELLNVAKEVIAIEVDSKLIPILKEELKEYDNLTLINEDILKINLDEIVLEKENLKLVANLPYYATTPIIAKILKQGLNFKSLTVMIQKEVGERMSAKPKDKEYGSLSLLVQYYCNINVIRKVSPSSFIPRPKVDSIIIRLDKLQQPRVSVKDEELFFKIIRTAFNMRRKTMWNVIKSLSNLDKEIIERVFKLSNIDPKRRGETLSVEEFALLSDSLHELI